MACAPRMVWVRVRCLQGHVGSAATSFALLPRGCNYGHHADFPVYRCVQGHTGAVFGLPGALTAGLPPVGRGTSPFACGAGRPAKAPLLHRWARLNVFHARVAWEGIMGRLVGQGGASQRSVGSLPVVGLPSFLVHFGMLGTACGCTACIVRPLLFTGPLGLGKEHLLEAWCPPPSPRSPITAHTLTDMDWQGVTQTGGQARSTDSPSPCPRAGGGRLGGWSALVRIRGELEGRARCCGLCRALMLVLPSSVHLRRRQQQGPGHTQPMWWMSGGSVSLRAACEDT